MKCSKWLVGLLSILLLLLFISSAIGEAVENEAIQFVKTGDIVQFGHYEIDNNVDNGKEPIEWKVLEVKDDHALLISAKAIDGKAFDQDTKFGNWYQSGIRKWLNSDFLQESFSEKERSLILVSNLANKLYKGEPLNAIVDGPPSEDFVFLLSHDEALQYMPESIDRKAFDTDYARSKGNIFASVYNLVV